MKHIKKNLASCIVGVAGCASPALAQAVPAPIAAAAVDPTAHAGAQGQLEEIIVTAQKRSENQQNVPIAVSAVTGERLAKSGITDLLNIRSAVPSLNVTSTNGRLTPSVRGIGSTAVGGGIENPIALYVDGVYYASTTAGLLSLNQTSAERK